MLADTDRFRINEPHVIGEVMDGELVLVQFESGCYYSTRESGSDAWNLLILGHTPRQVAEILAAHHGVDTAEVAAGVCAFAEQLVAEQLLVPTETAAPEPRPITPSAAAYFAPVLEKFDDLAGQLLLDPIHEIDQSGWPLRRAA
jgi:hypothetical protein